MIDFSAVEGMDDYLQFLLGNIALPPETRTVPADSGISFKSAKLKTSCSRCGGLGKLPAYHHINNGICFKCGGSGR